VAKIAETVDQDNVFIYPTDTVWGIGGSIFSKKATDLVRSVKKSQELKPLSILFDEIGDFFNYFSFPEKFDTNFFQKLFTLESTILLPTCWLKREIPSSITGGSSFIGCRCLNDSEITKIVKLVGGPITTTSLNLAGEKPIVNYKQALLFMKKYIPVANIIKESEKDEVLSGTPSTLISYDGNSFKLFREGTFSYEIKDLLGL
jgi:L-threonylcarbamoyladenylate synthase